MVKCIMECLLKVFVFLPMLVVLLWKDRKDLYDFSVPVKNVSLHKIIIAHVQSLVLSQMLYYTKSFFGEEIFVDFVGEDFCI